MNVQSVSPYGALHATVPQVTVPYLRSEYGKEYDFDAPVKLLDAMMHEQAGDKGQQVVVLGQVLAADINIGYEELVNIRVSFRAPPVQFLCPTRATCCCVLQHVVVAPCPLTNMHVFGLLRCLAGLQKVKEQDFIQGRPQPTAQYAGKITDDKVHGTAQLQLGEASVCGRLQVKGLNGVPVKNLRGLMEVAESSEDKYLRFQMEYNQLLVMETAAARAATPDILTMHYIPHDRSEELRGPNPAAAK